MTIHQAKGLEFPIVILPFLDTLIHPNLNEKIWYPFKSGKLKKLNGDGLILQNRSKILARMPFNFMTLID